MVQAIKPIDAVVTELLPSSSSAAATEKLREQLSKVLSISSAEAKKDEGEVTNQVAAAATSEARPKVVEEYDDPSCRYDCAICMNIMVEPVYLKCKHAFCMQCIKELCKIKMECALCRAEVGQNYKLQIA